LVADAQPEIRTRRNQRHQSSYLFHQKSVEVHKKEKLISLVNLARPLVIKLLRELSSISSTGKIREPGWPAEA
jgi:hypothetical protein